MSNKDIMINATLFLFAVAVVAGIYVLVHIWVEAIDGHKLETLKGIETVVLIFVICACFLNELFEKLVIAIGLINRNYTKSELNYWNVLLVFTLGTLSGLMIYMTDK